MEVSINGTPVSMEIDTGAAVSIMSSSTVSEKCPDLLGKLQPCQTKLTNYSGVDIPVMGQVEVQVKVKASATSEATLGLPLVIVQGSGETLLGRNWLSKIRLDWARIFSISGWNRADAVSEILSRHEDVFADGLGKYTGPEVHIRVAADAMPRFCKARPVPYAQRETVEQELHRLEQQGIIDPVDHSEWASPAVVVTKSDAAITSVH